MITVPEKTIFSVSQLNRHAKHLLETQLPLVWVSGEISNFAKPSSGHWYFSLKDERAQVRCAIHQPRGPHRILPHHLTDAPQASDGLRALKSWICHSKA